MDISIDIDLDEVIAWLEVAQQMPEMTEAEAAQAMGKAVAEVERQVVPGTPVGATGALRAAWSTKLSRGQRSIKGEIVNPKEYAIVVEKGRKASQNMAPIGPLAYWFVRKHGMSPDKAVKAAWGLAVNLTKRDIKPVKMLEKGFDAAEPTVKRIFDKVPETVFKRMK